MYLRRNSLNNIILISSLLLLHSINQASALKCYVCASTANGECFKNPKQESHQVDCTPLNAGRIPGIGQNQLSRSLDTVSNFFNYSGNPVEAASTTCFTFIGDIATEKAVIRMCSLKSLTCDILKPSVEAASNIKVQACETCDSDLCNSSSNLSVGFLSFIGCLLILLSTRL